MRQSCSHVNLLTSPWPELSSGFNQMEACQGSMIFWQMTTSHSCIGGTVFRKGGNPMRTTLTLMAVVLVFMTGCAATQRVSVKDLPAVCGFLGDACDLLQPGAKGEAGLRYVNPKARLTQYNKMMVEVVGFFGSDVAKVPPKEQEALVELFQQSLTEALAKRYQIVDQAGPGVAQIQVAVLDAEAATPGARSISMAIPQMRVLATGAYLVTGKYPFAGGAQAVAKFTDAVTGQLLGVAVDRQAGGGALKTVAQWQWGDAANAVKAWSEQISNNVYAYTSGARTPQ